MRTCHHAITHFENYLSLHPLSRNRRPPSREPIFVILSNFLLRESADFHSLLLPALMESLKIVPFTVKPPVAHLFTLSLFYS